MGTEDATGLGSTRTKATSPPCLAGLCDLMGFADHLRQLDPQDYTRKIFGFMIFKEIVSEIRQARP